VPRPCRVFYDGACPELVDLYSSLSPATDRASARATILAWNRPELTTCLPSRKRSCLSLASIWLTRYLRRGYGELGCTSRKPEQAPQRADDICASSSSSCRTLTDTGKTRWLPLRPSGKSAKAGCRKLLPDRYIVPTTAKPRKGTLSLWPTSRHSGRGELLWRNRRELRPRLSAINGDRHPNRLL
jgi:hypothetical protein